MNVTDSEHVNNYIMQPSFQTDTLCRDDKDTSKLLGGCDSPTHWQQLQTSLLLQQLQEKQQQHLQSTMLASLNQAYLSISPTMAFTFDNFGDVASSGIGVGQYFGRATETDDAVVGSPLPPSLSSELLLHEGGFYLDQGVAQDPCCWNRGFDLELDSDQNEHSLLSGGKVGSFHQPGGGDPTLAALNAGSEDHSVLDDLDLDDLPLPDEIDCRGIRMSGLNTPTNDSQDGLLLGLSSLVGATAVVKQETPQAVGDIRGVGIGDDTFHELLDRSSASAPTVVPPLISLEGDWQDSGIKVEPPSVSPLPPQLPPDSGWNRPRTIRPRTATMSSAESLGSVVSSAFSSEISQDTRDESHDEGFDSDLDESDHCSDAESTSSWDQSHRSRSPTTSASRPRRKERFFWQYNLQAKGPKGNRMPLATDPADPHMLDEVTDPVFSPNCQVKGIKHTGKARRGDGNDLTPNPCKLHQIGEELKKLNKVIDDLTPVGELPFNVRPKSRKEKNKLASRACRLKKKAQHEANKIKLYGLEQEHRRLMFTLTKTKSMLRHHIDGANKDTKASKREAQENLESQLEAFANQATKSSKVAGNTIDFVNKVLAKVPTSGGRSAHELEQE